MEGRNGEMRRRGGRVMRKREDSEKKEKGKEEKETHNDAQGHFYSAKPFVAVAVAVCGSLRGEQKKGGVRED